MAVGAALTLATPLWCVLAGLVVATFCFFVAHAIAATWAGERVPAARSQASALYSLAYYAGSSLVGFLGAVVFDGAGWAGAMVMVIAGRGHGRDDRRRRRAALGATGAAAGSCLTMTSLGPSSSLPICRRTRHAAGRCGSSASSCCCG